MIDQDWERASNTHSAKTPAAPSEGRDRDAEAAAGEPLALFRDLVEKVAATEQIDLPAPWNRRETL